MFPLVLRNAMRDVIKINKDKNVYKFVHKLSVLKQQKPQHNNSGWKILIIGMQNNNIPESSDYKRKPNNTQKVSKCRIWI